MSLYNASLAGLCENLLQGMEDYQGINYAFDLTSKNGALDFILSPYNNTGNISVSQLQDENGKLRKARVVYKQGYDLDDIVTGTTAEGQNICDTGSEPEPNEVTVDIDDAIATPVMQFSESKLRLYCEDYQAFMRDYLFNALAKARQKLDRSILTYINVGAGVNYEEDGTSTAAGSSKSIDILTSDGLPRTQGLDEIIGDYENNQLNGAPAVIGQGNFSKFVRLQNMTCCNSSTPFAQSFDELGLAYYKDQNANAVLGTNELLVVAPGATKLLTANVNKHGVVIDTGFLKRLVIPDPVYGNALMWDLDFKFDECNDLYKWQARTFFEVFNTFQPDSFPSGSPQGNGSLQDMTGIFKYTAAKAS